MSWSNNIVADDFLFFFFSEEEIDVVSLGEKTTNGRSRSTATSSLPNNPSPQFRQQLQLKVAAMAASKTTQQQKSQQETKTVPIRLMLGDHTLVRSVPASSLRPGMKRFSSDISGSTKPSKRAKLHSTPSPRKRGSRSGSDSEDPIEKRSLHNNMERQRRIDLRNAFDNLRVLVPEVEENEKAAKVVILREAASYCHKLTVKQVSLNKKADELRRTQEQLRARVSQLRRMLAAKR